MWGHHLERIDWTLFQLFVLWEAVVIAVSLQEFVFSDFNDLSDVA